MALINTSLPPHLLKLIFDSSYDFDTNWPLSGFYYLKFYTSNGTSVESTIADIVGGNYATEISSSVLFPSTIELIDLSPSNSTGLNEINLSYQSDLATEIAVDQSPDLKIVAVAVSDSGGYQSGNTIIADYIRNGSGTATTVTLTFARDGVGFCIPGAPQGEFWLFVAPQQDSINRSTGTLSTQYRAQIHDRIYSQGTFTTPSSYTLALYSDYDSSTLSYLLANLDQSNFEFTGNGYQRIPVDFEVVGSTARCTTPLEWTMTADWEISYPLANSPHNFGFYAILDESDTVVFAGRFPPGQPATLDSAHPSVSIPESQIQLNWTQTLDPNDEANL